MEYDVEQLKNLGIDIQMGYDYTGGQDKYISALQRYYKSSDRNISRINEYLNTGDTENLTITVHSLKSNSKMIGAARLSSEFETLENALRSNDMDTVNDGIEQTMEDYVRLIEALKPLGEQDTFMAAGEITADEAKDTADKLFEALDEFDDILAAKLAARLAGYPFRITQRDKLREAADNINNFMYDEAAELIREIYREIE